MSGASGGRGPTAPLTEKQRRLVRDNIGLVAVHLRRHVGNLSVPRRDREWDDLFQEGCLGLIKAAATYREDCGIPFAAFALRRIHNAVSRALTTKFATVYVPPHRARRNAVRPDSAAGCSPDEPKVRSLSDDLERGLADRRVDPDTSGRDDGETIGDRLRGKYERAVRAAGGRIGAKTSTRGDRARLVRTLVEERLLVPHDESRRALRQIARDTRSSYARVAQCDKQLQQTIRDTLGADPEVRELQHRARTDPRGVGATVDAALERDLAAACADEFVCRFRSTTLEDRAALLTALMQMSGRGMEGMLRGRVLALPSHRRERLLRRPVENGTSSVRQKRR